MSTVYEFNSPPIRNQAWYFYVWLTSQSDTDVFQASPTIVAGDFKHITNASPGVSSNLDTLPSADGSVYRVRVDLSADEMDFGVFTVEWIDQADDEWQSGGVEIRPVSAVTVSDGTGVTLADDAITAAKIATDAIGSDEVAVSAVTKIQNGLSTLTAAQVWSYATRTLSSFGTFAADVWSSVTRTLTQSAASVESAVSGSAVTQYRDSTIYFTLTGLGSLAGRTKLYFTVKRDLDEDDDKSIFQVEESAGLKYVNRVETTIAQALDGTLTVNDEDTGSITVKVAATRADELPLGSFAYSVKIVRAAAPEVYPVSEGTFVMKATATRSVS